jgi:hypothetical protein
MIVKFTEEDDNVLIGKIKYTVRFLMILILFQHRLPHFRIIEKKLSDLDFKILERNHFPWVLLLFQTSIFILKYRSFIESYNIVKVYLLELKSHTILSWQD